VLALLLVVFLVLAGGFTRLGGFVASDSTDLLVGYSFSLVCAATLLVCFIALAFLLRSPRFQYHEGWTARRNDDPTPID
jgi:hypothetical protein